MGMSADDPTAPQEVSTAPVEIRLDAAITIPEALVNDLVLTNNLTHKSVTIKRSSPVATFRAARCNRSISTM